jgi:hypothetical protein
LANDRARTSNLVGSRADANDDRGDLIQHGPVVFAAALCQPVAIDWT